MRAIFFLLIFLSFSFAQFYDVSMVRANDTLISSLVYDDNSTSYKDNSIENPDLLLRICGMQESDLLNKWVGLTYADGFDGDYLLLMHAPVQITSVPPSLCVFVEMDISSFKAWYPSIPYVHISDTPDMGSGVRWKLSRVRGWFSGNYTLNETRTGTNVEINVTDALDDQLSSIVPDVDYLVIGIVRNDFTTMDTAISSLNNAVNLTADSASAFYTIFINGIGPDIPPYVEIITPEPIEYDSGIRPFTYIMYDDDDIVDCWYVLDGTTVNMPVCGIAYILNVGPGTHTLFLYGEDTTGNIGSDSVVFRVTDDDTPGKGGGGSGIPYYQPIIPPPPLHLYFSILDEIYIVLDYPQNGSAEFRLWSNHNLTNLNCFVRGDFENYSSVEINGQINENQTLRGLVNVSMMPLEMLTYNDSFEGLLQCTGNTDPTLISSTHALVHLIINRPEIEIINQSTDVVVGEQFDIPMLMGNVRQFNASTINLTIGVGYPHMVSVINNTRQLENSEWGTIDLHIDATDAEIGIYEVPVIAYENGIRVGKGYLILNIIAPKPPAAEMCVVPDLRWTLVIILLSLGLGVWMFLRKIQPEESPIPASRVRRFIKHYKIPSGYELASALFFFVLWIVVVILLARCW